MSPRVPCTAAAAGKRRSRLTLLLPSEPHPVTLQVRQGRVERLDGGGLQIWLPKKLESPNAWLWTHWRTKVAAKRAWAFALRLAVVDTLRQARLDVERPALALGWLAPTTRVRVVIDRQVTSARAFIKDRENRYFAGKALVDCLVQGGFLRDDREADIDLEVTQTVSDDGGNWTVVTIDPGDREVPRA
jgi:hypothetical protein